MNGAVLVFVVDGGELGVGLFDALGYFAHGKNMTKFYLLFVIKKKARNWEQFETDLLYLIALLAFLINIKNKINPIPINQKLYNAIK